MKKNCHNCEHLEFVEADEGNGSGFTCNKRYDRLYEQSEAKADWLHEQLDKDSYRQKSKVCFEIKAL